MPGVRLAAAAPATAGPSCKRGSDGGADAFEIGGYEPNASLLHPGEGERLVEAVVAMASAAPAA